MLALEVCLAGTDPVPTMVFDEVDAGVGGRAAVEVGRRLARLAREHQVHRRHAPGPGGRVRRPAHRRRQAAGDGERRGGVTASDVRVVAGDDRVAELARMLAGTDSPTACEHAAELLRRRADARTARRADGAPSGETAEHRVADRVAQRRSAHRCGWHDGYP